MADGFLDFAIGENDGDIGKKTRRFVAEDGRSYRVSFGWISVPIRNSQGEIISWDDDAAYRDGKVHPDAQVRFAGCNRGYIKGVGYYLHHGPAYAQFGQPKQVVATVLIVWPTDKEGELDTASFNAGKGWSVQPWIFSTDKYTTIKKLAKRSSLMTNDLAIDCPLKGAEFQKLTFASENSNLFRRLLEGTKPETKAVLAKVLDNVRAAAAGIYREMAQDKTVDQIREALGQAVETPTGSSSSSSSSGGRHSNKDVDDLLDGVL